MSSSLFFPHPELANPYGLLAIGGDLSTNRLLLAYQFGIFPWYSEGQDIMWWTPDPRCVLLPDRLYISKSMRRLIRKEIFTVTTDQAFNKVISKCSQIRRKGQEGTWITAEMRTAYQELHVLGHAHSVEVWQQHELVGGLYGVSLGKIFFGESMFTTLSNASKYGFIKLVQWLKSHGFQLIDCQQETQHLLSLGAELVSRALFMQYLRANALELDTRAIWKKGQKI